MYTVKKLRQLINDLPDDMRVFVAANGSQAMNEEASGPSEGILTEDGDITQVVLVLASGDFIQ